MANIFKLMLPSLKNLKWAVSEAKSFDDNNMVIKPISPIPSRKEEKLKFMPICHRGEFFVESREIEQSLALEKVSPTVEISKEIDQSLEECNEVVHDNLLDILPSMKDLQHLDMFILHDFEDHFLQKESTRDEIFKFFDFVSPTISTWAQRVLQDMPNFISN